MAQTSWRGPSIDMKTKKIESNQTPERPANVAELFRSHATTRRKAIVVVGRIETAKGKTSDSL